MNEHGITLTKFHGLGNDFLVCRLDQALPRLAWEVVAQRWCDRRRGVGADGLLLLGQGESADGAPERLTMSLLNADGSRAEMSGNGIRCLVHAAHRHRGRLDEADYLVGTDAGERLVRIRPTSDRDAVAEVDMGEVTSLDPPPDFDATAPHPDRPVAHLDLGNPHSVVAVDDVSVVDLARLGALVPMVNLEIVEPGPERHGVTMRVHERGVGVTEACGTGASAVAWAASRWGLVDPLEGAVTVHMDGGDVIVRLDTPAPGRVTLVGPSTYIATVQVSV
jgi:diaminopimelate epimerase